MTSNSFTILNYLEKRQYGFNGFRRNVNDMFIEKLGYLPRKNNNNTTIDVGNTFACKFSRNKNNLHIIGCSSEHGEIIIKNTLNHSDSQNNQFERNHIHDNAIFNFAWSDSEMKLVTACGDQTSKLCSMNPSGKLVEEREFIYGSSVKSVMFRPESSDIFCGACQNSSIKIWDSRLYNSRDVMHFDHHIPNTHGIYSPVSRKNNLTKTFPASCIIFKNDQTIISCSSMDHDIKLWDLRKSYRQVKGMMEPYPLLKYNFDNSKGTQKNLHLCSEIGYVDMIINSKLTHLYASGTNKVIYCFSLDSDFHNPISQYSGHFPETVYSKISISNDGRYLFSGCLNNSGVLWFTGFPYNEKPMFTMAKKSGIVNELSTSDWCLDTNCLKLVTSSDSLPKTWYIISGEQKEHRLKFSKTSSYKPIFLPKMCTVPIKLEPELREYYNKETEKNLEDWDFEKKKLFDNIQTVTKNPWDILFSSKKCPLSSSQTSQLNNTVSNDNTHAITSKKTSQIILPSSSRKRKKTSPKWLMDRYLIPSGEKRGKLNDN